MPDHDLPGRDYFIRSLTPPEFPSFPSPGEWKAKTARGWMDRRTDVQKIDELLEILTSVAKGCAAARKDCHRYATELAEDPNDPQRLAAFNGAIKGFDSQVAMASQTRNNIIIADDARLKLFAEGKVAGRDREAMAQLNGSIAQALWHLRAWNEQYRDVRSILDAYRQGRLKEIDATAAEDFIGSVRAPIVPGLMPYQQWREGSSRLIDGKPGEALQRIDSGLALFEVDAKGYRERIRAYQQAAKIFAETPSPANKVLFDEACGNCMSDAKRLAAIASKTFDAFNDRTSDMARRRQTELRDTATVQTLGLMLANASEQFSQVMATWESIREKGQRYFNAHVIVPEAWDRYVKDVAARGEQYRSSDPASEVAFPALVPERVGIAGPSKASTVASGTASGGPQRRPGSPERRSEERLPVRPHTPGHSPGL